MQEKFMSLYRKYRPQTFDELIGQDHVVLYFKNAIRNNEVSHAYIFAGPRGTGKTTTARILAKVLNCKNPKDYNPCNECENCKAINSGSFIDVIELDAASNRGIDEIRNIRDSASYRPIHGKYKVYIIDEFHMLTREAFNALLKTLEEPPEHVVFVLATTNLEKVPETIISRAQVIQFRNIGEKYILKRLKEVCKKEGIKANQKSLEIIARKSKGGMRDALSMLEQVVKFAGKNIDENDVFKILGLFDEDFIRGFIDTIFEGETNKILDISNDLFNEGKEVEILLEESIEYILYKLLQDESYQDKHEKLIYLSKKFSDLMRELRYSEMKKVLFDVNLLLLTYELSGKKENTKVPESTDEDEMEKIEKPEEMESKRDDIVEKVMEYFLNNEDRMDLSIYFALKRADIKIDKEENKVYINLPEKELLLEYQILKMNRIAIEMTFNQFSKEHLKVEIKYQGKTLEEEIEEKSKKAQTLSLFEK